MREPWSTTQKRASAKKLIAHAVVLTLAWLSTPSFAAPDNSDTTNSDTARVASDNTTTARALIQSAMDLWRGKSSAGSMTMTIHRPTWERSMTIESHTLGLDQSLLRVTAPKKDAGNATLLLDDDMWSFSPRINRVIKIPSSMMSQSWMGSDLSNRDITKDTDIIDEYEHSLTATYASEGHTVYQITSIPHESAAVVWGKEIHHVRDDFLILKQEFFDQDGRLAKLIETLEHDLIDGRPVATLMQVRDIDTPDEWTQMRINHVEFDVDLDPNLFTVANLRRGL